MATTHPQASVRVGRNGRVVIPVGLRRQLGIREGSALLVRADPELGGRLIMEPRDASWTRLRSLFASAPHRGSVVGELIAERRAEAARE